MALIEFKNLPDTSTPLNAENLNNNFNEVKVESGSNENGSWIKFADGTMICTHIMTPSSSNTTYHYYSGIWTYPVPFAEVKSVNATPKNWNTSMVTTKVKPTITSCSVMTHVFSLATKEALDEAVEVSLIAIGKWK